MNCSINKCNYPALENEDYCHVHMREHNKRHSNKRLSKPNRKKKSTRNKKGTRVKLIPIPKLDAIVWQFCSIAFRLQDSNQMGHINCATCGKQMYFYGTKDAQMGHFISRRVKSTKFIRHNMATQCGACNGPMGGGKQYLMGKYLDNKYGSGTADSMIELSNTTLKLDRQDYKRLLIDFILLAYQETESKNLRDWQPGMLKWQKELYEFVINDDNPYDKELKLNKYKLP